MRLSTRHPRPLRRARPGSPKLRIVTIVALNLLCFITIGLQLSVLPGFVHHVLGFDAATAGLVISIEYLATLLSRPFAGRIVDNSGPKHAQAGGLACCALTGALLLCAGLLASRAPGWPGLVLLVLLVGRLVLGLAESLTVTGSITWAIGLVGAARTGLVISWNGAASYGGLSAGAPLGVLLGGHGPHGIAVLGLVSTGLGGLGLAIALNRPPVAPTPGEPLAFLAILGRVLPHGVALGLGSVGFGVIAAFIALFFSFHGWPQRQAAFALSMFGAMFMLSRMLFGGAVGRHGGYVVGLVSLAAEAAGLLVLWQASGARLAILGAGLAGGGFSLVFPALGVEAVKRVGAGNRGSALSAYTVFLDISLALSGPLLGLVANRGGYALLFLIAAIACLAGFGLTAWLRRSEARGHVMLAPRS